VVQWDLSVPPRVTLRRTRIGSICSAVQCSAVQCSAVQQGHTLHPIHQLSAQSSTGKCLAVPYGVQCSAVQLDVQCSAVVCSVHCSAVQCSAVQWGVVQCSVDCREYLPVTPAFPAPGTAAPHNAVQCSAVQCSAVQCSAVQCSAVLPAPAALHNGLRGAECQL
jgi:hypothetical protein